ncbi:Hypothetical Protein FCC1311_101632 [Hondaea fermentalgiana]|uniref:Uncharacterized protein n=1 Tax=Hondaea fermentalgiana TaxID=2315210 RepID=A0A2R5GSX2_9STRA|nr:Hypothetical Protein FCC1311_101632 [Hondaea fermentalgiana]|eukprot:GBG33940.1 Hypothetical Protein FCC1311_101632 [Hondaea fermentalgiana]
MAGSDPVRGRGHNHGASMLALSPVTRRAFLLGFVLTLVLVGYISMADVGGTLNENLEVERPETEEDPYHEDDVGSETDDTIALEKGLSEAAKTTDTNWGDDILDPELDCVALTTPPDATDAVSTPRNLGRNLRRSRRKKAAGALCSKTLRRTPSWFIAADKGNREICKWFNHFHCAFNSCSSWNYFQVHYVQNYLYLHDEETRNAIDALGELPADARKPGPQVGRLSYKDGVPVYKRPHRLKTKQYLSYIHKKAAGLERDLEKQPEMPMPRNLWLLWLQGEEHMRKHSKLNSAAIDGWRKLHPDWNITVVDASTLAKFAPLTAASWPKDHRGIWHLSDLLRLELVCRYGGVWADASLVPVLTLDEWLPDAFAKPGRKFVSFHFTEPFTR